MGVVAMNRTKPCTLTLLGLLLLIPSASHGEGCLRRPPTPFRDDVDRAQCVFLTEAVTDPTPTQWVDPQAPVTGFRVLEVLKTAPGLERAGFIPREPLGGSFRAARDSRWILFCTAGKKGEAVPFRFVAAPSADPLDYVKGLIRFSGDLGKSLAHCLRYLEHANLALAEDALLELFRAEDRHLRVAVRGHSAERVAGWLRDPKTTDDKRNAYGLLLGYCGGARHADLLLESLRDVQKREYLPIDRLLIGYTMLRPEEGWPLVQRLLRERNPRTVAQSSALSAARYFWEQRTDVLPRADLLQVLVPLLTDPESGDSVLGDLRRWRRWEFTELVLRQWDRPFPSTGARRLGIVAFALRSPRPQAAAFVQGLRRTERDLVEAAEAVLKLEDHVNDLARKGRTGPR
jgi:hypothetical protein